MPTYDYLCESCGYRFEEFQSITAEPLTECIKCKGKVTRLLSPGNGFLFKGSGFYITDYRSDSYNKGREKEKNTGKETATEKNDVKTEQKSTVNNLA